MDADAEEFLAQFTDEYYGGAVHKTKPRVRKDGTAVYGSGKIRKGHLHNTDELAKDCYKRNNDLNNDLMGVNKANHLLSDIESELKSKDGWYITNSELTEDAMISDLTEKASEDSFMTREEFEKVRDQLTPEMLLFYLSFYELD